MADLKKVSTLDEIKKFKKLNNQATDSKILKNEQDLIKFLIENKITTEELLLKYTIEKMINPHGLLLNNPSFENILKILIENKNNIDKGSFSIHKLKDLFEEF